MKRRLQNLLIILLLIALAAVSGCAGNPSSQKESAAVKPAPAAAEQTKPLSVPAGVPILMYHSISNEKNNDAVIAPELFAEQMAFLSREGYHPITLDALYAYLTEGKPLPQKPVVLTFDDGYRDTYEVVYPILKRYGFAATLFVSTEFIGERLTVDELKEMKAAGIAIMSHSGKHRELAPLSAEEQVKEISSSKQKLDELFSQDTRHFCYPNGSYSQETLRLLKQQGFKLAVTLEPGWVRQGDNPLTLRRVWIGNSVTLRYFGERVSRSDYTML